MSTLTLLNVVNNILRRARVIDSVDDVLTSLTDDALQIDIDMAVDAWNDTVREVYQIIDRTPFESAEGSITLALDEREYAVPSDFVTMESANMINQGDGHKLVPYPEGYAGMFDTQTQPDNYVGQPSRWVINPISGAFRVDTNPQSEQVGDVYKFMYAKDIHKTAAGDLFPFSDSVVRRMIPAATETYKRDSNSDLQFDAGKKLLAVGEAVRALTHTPKAKSY